jgi:YVTN family beta-propeller protein
LAALAALVLAGPDASDAAPFVYVVNKFSDSVSVIDASVNTVVATVDIDGSGPTALAVNPDGTRVYVTRFGDDALSIIDTATNEVVATIPNLVAPLEVAADPSGRRAYLTHGAIQGYVSVLDTATNRVVNTIPVGSFPFGVAVSPDGSRVYVTNTYSTDETCPGSECIALTVSVIDTAERRETQKVIVGASPRGIAVDPTGTRVYVAVRRPPADSGQRLAVIDATVNRVLEWIPVRGYPSVVVAPSGDYVYTAGGNEVSVVATNCNLTVANLLPRASADAVAVTPDGRRLYVANQFDDTVSVIDTATYSVIDTVAVGDGPSAVAIGPEVIGASPSPTAGTPPVPTATPDPGEPCGDTCVAFERCRAPCGARIVPGYCAGDCRCVAIGTETPTPTPVTPSPTMPPSPSPSPTPTDGDSCDDACTPGENCTGTVGARYFFGLCFPEDHGCRCFEQGTITPTRTTSTRTATPTPTRPPMTMTATGTPTRTVTPAETHTPTPTYTHTRLPTATATPMSTATSPPTPSPTLQPTLPTPTIPPRPTKTTPPGSAGSNGCTLAPAASSTPAATMLWLPLLLLFTRRPRRGARRKSPHPE